MDFDVAVRLAVYRHFAETGTRPTVGAIATRVGAGVDAVRAAYGRLRGQRVLVLEPDGETIRMAPPFSGVPTPHTVTVAERSYFANCAWDAFGIAAAIGADAVAHSRCGQSGEPLTLAVGVAGPGPSDWLFHCPVPAARWWEDIVFT